jgi:hypothetical protein
MLIGTIIGICSGMYIPTVPVAIAHAVAFTVLTWIIVCAALDELNSTRSEAILYSPQDLSWWVVGSVFGTVLGASL